MTAADNPSATQPMGPVYTPTSQAPLPVEILSQIITQLSPSELGRTAQASRLLYLIATPLLYKSVHIDLDHSVNPLFIDGIAIPYPSFAPEPIIPSHSDNPTDDLINTSTLESTLHIPLIPLPNRFTFTTHLTLRAHNRKQCLSLPLATLEMPLLENLRVLPNPDDDRLDLCGRPHENLDPLDSALCCPIMRGLTPSKITLGGLLTGLSGGACGLGSKIATPPSLDSIPPLQISPFPAAHIKELIIHVGMPTGTDQGVGAEGIAHFLLQLPDTVEKLTLVLSTSQNGWDALASGGEGGCYDAYCVKELLSSIAAACVGKARIIELADYEETEKCWIGDHTDLGVFRDVIKDEVEALLDVQGLSVVEAKARAGAIKFITRVEWEERIEDDDEAQAEVVDDWDDKAVLREHFHLPIRA